MCIVRNLNLLKGNVLKNLFTYLLSLTLLLMTAVLLLPSEEPESTTSYAELHPDACVVTINDAVYDITELVISHTGGDIFLCGTDMTESFYSEHDDVILVEDMVKYLVE